MHTCFLSIDGYLNCLKIYLYINPHEKDIKRIEIFILSSKSDYSYTNESYLDGNKTYASIQSSIKNVSVVIHKEIIKTKAILFENSITFHYRLSEAL